MKKSLSVNISNKIFNIDEDAYALLDNYLNQLRLTFPGDEGEEIVSDIEARISEIFAMKSVDDDGKCIINLADVHSVIERMGSPEEISASDVASEPSNPSTPPPLNNEASQSQNNTSDDSTIIIKVPSNNGKKLYRSSSECVLGGVVGGLATFLGWNPWVMRVLLVIMALFTYIAPFFIIYLIIWMIVPEARTSRQRLEQQGAPVTVETVGEEVRAAAETPSTSSLSTFERIISVLAKCFVALIGIVAATSALSALVGLVCSCFTAIGFAVMPYEWMVNTFNFNIPPYVDPILAFSFLISVCIAIFIPLLAIALATLSLLSRKFKVSTWICIVAVILEVLAIAASIILGFALNIH
jgi:phage shock protein PspC (stress-responsive transcriptional regulator)